METPIDQLNRIYMVYEAKMFGLHSFLWEILINKVRTMNLKSALVYLVPQQAVGMADMDLKGYTPLSIGFKDDVPIKERQEIIEDLNRELFELDPKQALTIVISTMRQ